MNITNEVLIDKFLRWCMGNFTDGEIYRKEIEVPEYGGAHNHWEFYYMALWGYLMQS